MATMPLKNLDTNTLPATGNGGREFFFCFIPTTSTFYVKRSRQQFTSHKLPTWPTHPTFPALDLDLDLTTPAHTRTARALVVRSLVVLIPGPVGLIPGFMGGLVVHHGSSWLRSVLSSSDSNRLIHQSIDSLLLPVFDLIRSNLHLGRIYLDAPWWYSKMYHTYRPYTIVVPLLPLHTKHVQYSLPNDRGDGNGKS